MRHIPAISERRYFLSFDLGRMQDFTAGALIVRAREGTNVWEFNKSSKYAFGGWNEPNSLSVEKERVHYEVPRLKRLPLGTPYPDIVAHVAEMFAKVRQEDARAELILDATGVGRAVVDMFDAAGLRPIAVTLHGGNETTRNGRELHLPKRVAIQRLEAALHVGDLKLAKGQPEVETLRAEMMDFRARYTTSGALTFQHRDGAHDDLLLALAIGFWYAAQTPREIRAVKIVGM